MKRIPVIVIVQIDQFFQFQMIGERGGFRGNAFHQIAIANDPLSEVIDDLKSGAIVARSQVRLRHSHAHPIAETLTERSCRRLHSRGQAAFRMAGRLTAPLTELFDLLE